MAYRIEHYLSPKGESPFQHWLERLTDIVAQSAIVRRLGRIEDGNFGDHRYCGDGVYELRVDHGPGYRVYYGISRRTIVLLLAGGEKHTQARDIDRACRYWRDFRKRTEGDHTSP